MRRRRFTLLTRPGCGLCEEFEAEVAAAFGHQLELEDVLVDAHPEWARSHGLSIPVLLDEAGRVVCAVQPDHEAIVAALARERGA